MILNIPYGEKTEKIEINYPVEILVPNKVSCKSHYELIKSALKNPIGFTSFEDFLTKSDKLLVLINDATRPTPTSKIIDNIKDRLMPINDLKFLIATGSHRPPTEEELKCIFGKNYEKFREKIYFHDSKKYENMDYFGKTKRNTEVYFNKVVSEYKNVLIIGSVEPHYFAGFTGGRKSFLPGVASYKTIEMNHKFALNPKAKTFGLNENPVHEDMIEAVKFLKNMNIFSIQSVLTKDNEIYAVTSGKLDDSFKKAVGFCKEIYSVKYKEKGDIVITVAPNPMDINLYQSQKALENGKLALKDNGIIILISKCREGVGQDTFLKLLSKSDSAKELLEILDNGYKLGYHKSAKIAEIASRAEIWAVTDLEDKIIKKAKMKPFSDISSAIYSAISKIKSKKIKPKIIFMPCGSLTVPEKNKI